MDDQLQQPCKNCGNIFSGNYSNLCGEKVYTEKDKKLLHILEEGFHFITHFEGKFLNTLKTILLYPGRLSQDYSNGIRKKYFKPLSFFLMLVVLYLLFPTLKGLNLDLDSHASNSWYGEYVTKRINEIAGAHNWNTVEIARKHNAISGKVSKFLMFIIIPVMALFSWAVFRKKKKPLFDHFIFSTEMISFVLLWGFLLLPLLLYFSIKFFIWLNLGYIFEGETVIGFLLFSPFMFYVYKASRRFYQIRVLPGILFTLLFTTVFISFTLTIYRILLFSITTLFLR